MRKALAVAGAVIVLLVAILAFAILSLNRIISEDRAYVLGKLSAVLGRPVEVQDVTASLGWGVVLDITGLQVADDPAFSPLPMVQASEVVGEADLLPLLIGHLRLRRLVFKDLQARVVRDQGGEVNFAVLGKHRRAKAPPSGTLAPANPPAGKPSSEVAETAPHAEKKHSNNMAALERFALDTLSIQNATVSYTDLAIGGEPLQVTAIDLEISQFSATQPFAIAGKLAAFGADQNLVLSGEIGPLVGDDGKLDTRALPLDLKASIGPIALDQLRQIAALARVIPGPLSISDPTQATATVTGSPVALNFSLDGDLSASRVAYGSIFDKPASVPLKLSAAGSRSNGAIAIDLATLTLASLELKASHLRIGDGAIQVRLDSNRFDLASIGSTLPVSAQYNPSGAAELHADVHASTRGGPAAAPPLEAQGTLAFTSVTLKPTGGATAAVANLSGNIRFTGNGAVIEPTSFDLGSGHARMQAEVGSFDPLKGNFQFNDDALKVAEIVPSRKSGTPEELRQLSVAGTLGGTMSAPQLDANLNSSAGSINNVAYQNLALTGGYGDRRADVRSLKLNAFGGAIAASATATMTPARPFEARLSLDHIDIQQALASQKSKAADTIRGLLTGQIQLSGSGAEFEQIKPTLLGAGKASIQDGKLLGINVVAQGMKKAHGIPGIGDLVTPAIIARHPELFASPDTDISQASLSFTIADQQIVSHDIKVQSPDYGLEGDGRFDFDQHIDLKARIVIAKELSGELEANKRAIVLLTNKQGEVEIPLQIVGMLPKPKVEPDIQAIAQNVLEGKANQLLGGILGKKHKGLGKLFGGSLDKLFH
jgi:hypothetical protein